MTDSEIPGMPGVEMVRMGAPKETEYWLDLDCIRFGASMPRVLVVRAAPGYKLHQRATSQYEAVPVFDKPKCFVITVHAETSAEVERITEAVTSLARRLRISMDEATL